MIQSPNMEPQSVCYPQPSYNAVKIDIHQPTVNAATPAAAPQYTAPISDYPKAPVYEVPQQRIYEPKAEIPAPVIQAPVVTPPIVTTAPAPVAPSAVTPAPAAVAQAEAVATPQQPVQKVEATAPVQTASPEVVPPVSIEPKLDLNAFLAKLTDNDFNVQANAMESIANLAQNEPQKATELLDAKVIDSLLGIMSKDSSKLEGPSQEQLTIREKIMSNKAVTDAESAIANTITPMEQAERNKQYALYTTAILQKLYGNEIEKLTNTVVPMTELPGSVGVVEQLKTNPNPMVRAAAVDALSYIQHPAYKKDLTTVFNLAKNDVDPNVKDAATKALAKLQA